MASVSSGIALKERVNTEGTRYHASRPYDHTNDWPYKASHRNSLHPLTILCYHRIARDTRLNSYCSSALSASQFYEQMNHLRRSYEVLPIEEALLLLDAGALPRKAVSITFDDGYLELMDAAFPVLRDLRLPATVFLVAEHVGSGLPFWWEEVAFRLGILHKEEAIQSLKAIGLEVSVWRSGWIFKIIDALKGVPTRLREEFLGILRESTGGVRLPRMSLNWEEVRKAQAWGISLGSHSLTHPILPLLSDEALERELRVSREIIESMTGTTCRLLAYPNGDHDDRVRTAAQQAGYRWAVTMERGRNRPGANPLALRRHPVYAHYSQPWFAAVLRGWFDLPPWVFRLVNDARDHKIWPSISPNRMI